MESDILEEIKKLLNESLEEVGRIADCCYRGAAEHCASTYTAAPSGHCDSAI